MEIAVGHLSYIRGEIAGLGIVSEGDEIRGPAFDRKGLSGSVEGIGILSNPIVREMPLAA